MVCTFFVSYIVLGDTITGGILSALLSQGGMFVVYRAEGGANKFYAGVVKVRARETPKAAKLRREREHQLGTTQQGAAWLSSSTKIRLFIVLVCSSWAEAYAEELWLTLQLYSEKGGDFARGGPFSEVVLSPRCSAELHTVLDILNVEEGMKRPLFVELCAQIERGKTGLELCRRHLLGLCFSCCCAWTPGHKCGPTPLPLPPSLTPSTCARDPGVYFRKRGAWYFTQKTRRTTHMHSFTITDGGAGKWKVADDAGGVLVFGSFFAASEAAACLACVAAKNPKSPKPRKKRRTT